ncbi:flavonoid 3',5'-hydroxylase 1-like [Curcuma longa]|uniref:flavonoid 3',5'-hydroxylase 1-like n=1 Tax=Curcuma longa TaxID=136217 RepID=UPI003D9DFC0A
MYCGMDIDPYFTAAAAAAATALFVALQLLFGFRRRSLRLPLPPGPRGVPIFGALHLIGAHAHVSLASLAAKHGPVMFLRLGSHGCVVASDSAAAGSFLKALDLQFANRPDIISARDISYNRQNLVMADYTPTWKLLRRACTLHFLGGKALAEWGHVRHREIALMVRSLSAQAGPVALPDVLVCALANVIGVVVMSKRVFDSQGEESNQFKEMVLAVATGGGQFNLGDFFPSIAWMDLQGIQGKMKRAQVAFDEILTKLLAEHEARKEEREREGRPDFLDKIMNGTKDGEALTDANIRSLIVDLFVAGSDTTAIVVEWAIAEMLKNPSILKRAQEEADAAIGHGRLLRESDLPNLPFLHAICKEALRLHPPTPLALPHFSYEPCEVNGFHVPANTRLLVNIWAIGRDPRVWPDPLRFDPDRFMGQQATKYDPLGSDFELIPFGAGRRVCTGKAAAMLLLQYMLGVLVHAFDWRLPEGEKLDMEEKYGLTTPKLVPLKALLTPRLSPTAYDAA